jgi:thiamine transport system ATP-binding protein
LILPGTVLMAGLGALIGSGELSFWHAWLAGIVGCLLGDWISFGLGLNPGLKLNAAQQEKMHAIARQMGIDNLMARLPGELSGGQRQRVALARCLVREQPILLLDEPFSALDPALRQEMLTLVSTSCQQQKMTLLMVSHSVEDAARIATRSVVVADGRIAWQGMTDELLSGKASASALLGITG